MTALQESLAATRKSLLLRLRNSDDQEIWREFFRAYWKLIYSTAAKAGLTDAEAQDVVQETVIAVSRHIKKFEFNPERASFKTWLGTITRSKIVDQFRKRLPVQPQQPTSMGEPRRTSTLSRIPASSSAGLKPLWDAEWRQYLLDTALAKVKRLVNPKHFQVFHLHVIEGKPEVEVAATFGVSVEQVRLIKCRVAKTLNDEVERLQAKAAHGEFL